MNVMWYDRYGHPREVLEAREIEVPDPGPGEVRIEVRASSVQPLDWHLMTGEPRILRAQMGLRTKRHIPGADIAGVVDAVGVGVARFQAGDEVFGEVDGGGVGEYVVAKETHLVHMPEGATFEEAAAVPVAGMTALQGLRDWGRLQPGHRVLVVGASGGVGTYAVQIAKALGARVTAVCSTRNVENAVSLGAEEVIDYTQDDFTDTDQRYDVIFDVPGNRGLLTMRRLLEPGGTYVMIGGPKGRWISPLPTLLTVKVVSLFGGRRMTFGLARTSGDDLAVMADWMSNGRIRSVIDRNYKLAEAAEALAYIGEGHARGKVVVTI